MENQPAKKKLSNREKRVAKARAKVSVYEAAMRNNRNKTMNPTQKAEYEQARAFLESIESKNGNVKRALAKKVLPPIKQNRNISAPKKTAVDSRNEEEEEDEYEPYESEEEEEKEDEENENEPIPPTSTRKKMKATTSTDSDKTETPTKTMRGNFHSTRFHAASMAEMKRTTDMNENVVEDNSNNVEDVENRSVAFRRRIVRAKKPTMNHDPVCTKKAKTFGSLLAAAEKRARESELEDDDDNEFFAPYKTTAVPSPMNSKTKENDTKPLATRDWTFFLGVVKDRMFYGVPMPADVAWPFYLGIGTVVLAIFAIVAVFSFFASIWNLFVN